MIEKITSLVRLFDHLTEDERIIPMSLLCKTKEPDKQKTDSYSNLFLKRKKSGLF